MSTKVLSRVKYRGIRLRTGRLLSGAMLAGGAMTVGLVASYLPAEAQSQTAPATQPAPAAVESQTAPPPTQSQAAPASQGTDAQKTDAGKPADATGNSSANPAANPAPATSDASGQSGSASPDANASGPVDIGGGEVTLTGTGGGAGTVAAGVASATIGDVIVTSRLREENLQDVPVPVTAVSGEKLDQQHQETVKDFAQTSPSLTVNAPNARQSSIAIRGVGKNIANEALEASVGVIVDGVFVALPGMTWGDYADLERIELIRGPQGTLLGKNTTLGVLNILTEPPSFTPSRELEVTYGNRNLVETKGNLTGTLIDHTLAYRASYYYDRQNPFLTNDDFNSPDVNGEANRWGARLQFLYTPNENVTNRTIIDHSQSDERNTATIKVADPQTFSDNGASRGAGNSFTSRLARFGYTPNFDPFNSVDLDQQAPTKTKQNGISNQTDWKTDGGYVVTSITAYKDYHFDALNDADMTSLPIAQGGYLVNSWQASQELRLTSPRNQEIFGQKFDWQAGLYALHTESSSTQRTIFGADAGEYYAPNALLPFGPKALSASLNNVFVHQEEHPVTTSLAAYGQETWHATDRLDLTLGIRNTYEEKTNWTQKWATGGADLSAYGPLASTLAAYRSGISQLFTDGTGKLDGKDIDADSWSWLVNPSYKLTDNVLAYASYSHGEKSGAVQFDQVSGDPLNVRPEKVEDFEVGVKAGLFDKTLLLNANLFWTDITDYQAILARPVPNTPNWSTYLGNIPGVRIRGVEVEGLYRTPVEGLNLTFSGSYNDGVYTSYADAQCSPDLSFASTQSCNYTGQGFPGVSRWIGNIGVDYSRPIFEGFTGYLFATNTYRSKVNYGSSELSVQDGYSVTNAGIGIHPNDGKWDLSFWGKNILDTHYYTALSAYTTATPVVGMAGDPIEYGATLRMKW
jgi:iron complex outermembrane recepter protein